MSINLKVYDNGDHTCLVWLPTDGNPIPNCRGFTIRRLSGGQETYLHGFVGFSDGDKFDPNNPWRFPVQRFMWWDYSIKPGDTIQYSVVPVVGSDKNNLQLDAQNASQLTPALTITGQRSPHISAYFNKGVVATQWVSRALDAAPKNSKIKNLVATTDNPLRNALSGLLRLQILQMLWDTKKNNGKIYAALYELNDPELIPALVALGRNCNLILANGAFKSNTPPDNDENAAVRAQLKTKINLFDRMVSQGHFGHNKFVVFCDSNGAPQRVLTGSTNWTTSGLCTQANNGLIVEDPAVAANFLDAWNRIKDAGNDYPPALVEGNSTAKSFAVDGCKVTPWFVKTSAAQDLQFARNLINSAKGGSCFSSSIQGLSRKIRCVGLCSRTFSNGTIQPTRLTIPIFTSEVLSTRTSRNLPNQAMVTVNPQVQWILPIPTRTPLRCSRTESNHQRGSAMTSWCRTISRRNLANGSRNCSAPAWSTSIAR